MTRPQPSGPVGRDTMIYRAQTGKYPVRTLRGSKKTGWVRAQLDRGGHLAVAPLTPDPSPTEGRGEKERSGTGLADLPSADRQISGPDTFRDVRDRVVGRGGKDRRRDTGPGRDSLFHREKLGETGPSPDDCARTDRESRWKESGRWVGGSGHLFHQVLDPPKSLTHLLRPPQRGRAWDGTGCFTVRIPENLALPSTSHQAVGSRSRNGTRPKIGTGLETGRDWNVGTGLNCEDMKSR
jgi:hypothetical protein